MSRKANPALVGIFVIGAVALLAAGVIVFGQGKLFTEKRQWVLYFDGSIKGLTPGSPVVFQGVRIGEVKNIRVYIDSDREIRIPVVMELDSSLIDFEEKGINSKEALEATMSMIERGLRAQLQTQSLITGQLIIQLGFYPDKEARFIAPGGPLPEMPTIRSTAQELSKTLENLPLEEIVNNIHSITKSLEQFLSSPELNSTLAEVNSTLKKAQSVMNKIEQQIDPIGSETQKLLASANSLLDNNDAKIGTLVEDLQKTSAVTREGVQSLTSNLKEISEKMNEQLTRFFDTANTTSGYAEKMLAEQSEFRHDLRQTLAELHSALRAIRLLAEYMEQHPEALLKGKAQ